MKKIAIILGIGVYLFNSCNSDKDYKSLMRLNSTIQKEVKSELSKNECLPVAISKLGFCSVSQIFERSDKDIYLYPNSTIKSNIENSGLTLKFCYSYIYKDTVFIRFHEGINDGNILVILDVVIHKDSFQINNSAWFNDNTKTYSTTTFQELTLDKKNYQVGDTIQGYLVFRGHHKTKIKRAVDYSGYFKCVIGEGRDPKDYINSYERCDTLSSKNKTIQ